MSPGEPSAEAAGAETSSPDPPAHDKLEWLQQGDVLEGIACAVVGAGKADGHKYGLDDADVLGPRDLFTVLVDSPSGYVVVTSQDCDIPKSNEPTVSVAPVVVVTATEAKVLRDGYSSRQHLLPDRGELPAPGTPGSRLVVDLSYETSVLRSALADRSLPHRRLFTGPEKADFAAWLGNRKGRVPFEDEVIKFVLGPAHDERASLARGQRERPPDQMKAEQRVALGVHAWYARVQGGRVDLLGVVDDVSLAEASLHPKTEAADQSLIEDGLRKLVAATTTRMKKVEPGSGGYTIGITLRRLADMPADEFVLYSLLVD